MKNLVTIALVIIIAVVFVRLAEMFWKPGGYQPSGPVAQDPSNPIDMIEPQGFPSRDQQNSNTNKNNAQAEVYRAQAELLYAQARDLENRAVLYPAEAEKLYAEAYAIRTRADATMLLAQAEYSKSPAGGVSIYKDGVETGKDVGASGAYATMVIAVLGAVVLLLLFARTK